MYRPCSCSTKRIIVLAPEIQINMGMDNVMTKKDLAKEWGRMQCEYN